MAKNAIVVILEDTSPGMYRLVPVQPNLFTLVLIKGASKKLDASQKPYVTALQHKLTDLQVAEIRQKYKRKRTTLSRLASEYNVTADHIHKIINHLGRFAKKKK